MFSSTAIPSSSAHRKRGFALIITVVLVAFLVLLVVSLATFTRVETVVSENSDSTAAARQHALMAANIAIGELQLAMGPDQRVSAPAVATPAPAVLGAAGLPASPGLTYSEAAWNTFATRLDEYWNTSGAQPTRRSPNWVGVWRNNGAFPAYAPRLVNWLVSGNEQSAVISGASHATPAYTPSQAVSGLGITTIAAYLSPQVNNNNAVVLVGNYSASGANNPDSPVAADLDRYVVAPKVDITGTLPDGSNGTIGRYGWWVGDLGTKASVNASTTVTPSYTGAPTGAALEAAIAQSTSRLGFEGIFPTFDPDPAWSRVLSVDQISFGPTTTSTPIPSQNVRAAFHDVGPVGYGLLTDTARGGLRVDLTRNPTSAPVGAAALAAVNVADSVGGAVLTDTPFLELNFNTSGTTPRHTEPDTNNSLNRTQPFDDIQIGTYDPVVAGARFYFGFDVESNPTGPFQLKLYPQLLLWNPYTSDFAWAEDAGGGEFYRNGYRYRIRLIYDITDNGGTAWDGSVQVGALWENTDAAGTFQSTETSFSLGTGDPLAFFEVNNHIAPPAPPLTNVVRREVIQPTPSALSAGSIDGNDLRLRAGDLALFRGAAFDRSASGSATVLGTSALPVPPFGNSQVTNARAVLTSPAAPGGGTIDRFVRLEVYARKVDRSGADVPNSTAGTGPHVDDMEETRVFRSGPIAISLAATRSSATFTDEPTWNNEWIAPTPATPEGGFFPGNDRLFDYAGGNYAPVNSAWLGIVVRSPADLDSFWDGIPASDPRIDTITSLERETLTAGFIPGGLAQSIDAKFGRLSTARAVSENTFPVLYEAFRTAPVSVGQLAHLPNVGGPSSMLLGSDPVSAPVSARPDIQTINEASWDGFFFSTLPTTLLAADIDTAKLANTRIAIARVSAKSDAETLNYLNENAGRPSAAALRVVAPLNINSPSSSAWSASLSGGGSQNITVSMWEPTNNRFLTRTASVDGNVGRFRQAPGIEWAARHRELYQATSVGLEGHQISLYRNGHRSLSPLDARARLAAAPYGVSNTNTVSANGVAASMADLVVLAGKIQARDRNGPYMSVADFVNSGTLEEVIANTPWWHDGQNPTTDTPQRGLNWWKAPDTTTWTDFSNRKGVPSFLSQREIMQAIAPVVSARSDTFVIRSYGEKLNPADNSSVEGKAWCELVVQRDVDYVDQTQNPQVGVAALNPVNDRYGRRFRVVSFRWLSAEDI